LPRPLSDISVTELKGVGAKVAEKLARLGIHSAEDLLFHLPLRYQDKSRITAIADLRSGEYAQIFARIEAADIVFGKRRSLVCKVSDGTGLLDIRLFYFSMAQKNQFKRGQYVQCYGLVNRIGRNYSMIHPQIRYLRDRDTPLLEEGLSPVYPTAEGLQQRTLAKIIEQALKLSEQYPVTELLPETIRTQQQMPALVDALKLLHHPPLELSLTALHQGDNPLLRRLAFEELLAQQLVLRRIRSQHQSQSAPSINFDPEKHQKLLSVLPFTLTAAQQRVVKEILADLQRVHPMMRLVQGDVGSGKTLVAFCAMLQAAASGYQAALMAPTEILAEQHAQSIGALCQQLGLKLTLLTSKMKSAVKKQALHDIRTGEAQLVVGTHALFQEQVQYHRLGLVVIDEQHRFGVEQRKTLLAKASQSLGHNLQAHQLVMTATPIPRTLAQTVYADLDLSVIDELPPGRKPIKTSVVSNEKRQQVVARIHSACTQDARQVYWVCTLIEDSEEMQAQAAEATFNELQSALPDLKIGLIHGRMKPEQKQQIMRQFKDGELQLLVATTVIEVGVDVPDASLMIIENPERLGLSQLHQLRGRVGRGDKDSYCLLLYQPPLSNTAKARLEVMRDSNDGFVIAEKDMQLRGPGELLGKRQTGAILYRFADLARDHTMLPEVQRAAEEILKHYPQLVTPLARRWVRQGEQLARV